MQKLNIKSSPFIIGSESTCKIMWTVNACLIPVFIAAIVFFGPLALLIMGISIATALLWEGIVNLIFKQQVSILDGSAFLTGLLIAFMMPPRVPLFIPVIASTFAILIIKMLFGGLGRNWLNPAIAGRVFVSLIWPKELSSLWQKPFYYLKETTQSLDALSKATHYPISGATPLELLVNHKDKIIGNGFTQPLQAMNYFEKNWDYLDMFVGNTSGSIGETSALLIILGAIYLFYKKIITFDITFSYLISFTFLSWMLGALPFKGSLFAGDPIFHLLSGGLMLGALFMATDFVTHPMTTGGRIVFGVGCSIITILFRLFTYFPEGVMFAILIMNLLTPLINKIFRVYPLGLNK